MTKRRLLFISSLFLLSGISLAQEEADSVISRRTVTPSIFLDYGKLLTIATDFETKYEGGLELLFWERFPLIVEVGAATLTPEGAYSNGTYESEGVYYRIGAGYLGSINPKNRIGLSARYGISNFDENGRIFIESPSGAQGTFVQPIIRENLTASWYEVVLYTDRKLSDLFSIGFNLRFRILEDYEEQSPVDVYAIPGYGRSFDKTIPAANFILKVSL